MDPQSSVKKPQELEQFSASDRIRDLVSIDASVTKILQAAGLAVQTLTGSPTTTAESQLSLEETKSQFSKRANEYVLASQSVIARLRRQIYALEEAKIIPSHRESSEPKQSQAVSGANATSNRPGATGASNQKAPAMQLTNGGLGKLDVGWLNSRIDRVGKQKEAELWAQTRKHLERLGSGPNGVHDDKSEDRPDVDMDG